MSIKNEKKIKLMKSTFYKEKEAKEKLINFISKAEKLSMGNEVLKWEENFAKWQNRTYSVAVNSGSSANLVLIQSLLNIGKLKKGDKVAFSCVTWSTNVMPLIQLGLVPIPVDVELTTLNISSKKLEYTLTKHPDIKCLFITNLLGFCDDLDVIANICLDKDIILIEDNCESLGSKFKGKKLGNFGIASTCSTFVGHHISTIEGGLVFTNDEQLFHYISMSRAHGWARNLPEKIRIELKNDNKIDNFNEPYTFYTLGFNLRPTELTGVLGCHELGYVDETIELRKNNFLKLFEASLLNNNLHHLSISHMDLISNFAFPLIAKSIEYRNKLIKIFNENNVEIRPMVAGSMVKQPFFQNIKLNDETDFINSNIIDAQGFYIPNNPELNDEDIYLISSLLKD